MAQTKTITIEENLEHPEEGVVVIIEQTAMPEHPHEESLEIGGVKLVTDLPWYGNAVVLLLLVALLYVGKKTIDKWFEKKNKGQGR
jgi:hypothetical protein